MVGTLDTSDLGRFLITIQHLHQHATHLLDQADGYWCYCKSWSCCRIFCTSCPWRACLVGLLDLCHVVAPLTAWIWIVIRLATYTVPLACTKVMMQDWLLNGTFVDTGSFEYLAGANSTGTVHQALDDASASCGSTAILGWSANESSPIDNTSVGSMDALDTLVSFRLGA